MPMSQPTDAAPTPTAAERRGAQRVAVELFVRELDGERTFVHPALNLSASGIFLESHSYSRRSAIERQYLDLEFELPDPPLQVQVRGEVVATRRLAGFSTGLAVAFIDLSPEQHDAIAQFVAGRLAAGESEGPRDEAAPTA
jgi:hypothetical protein